MTTEAENDLKSIFRYITNVLMEPIIAKKIYSTISKKIFALEYMAKRHKIVSVLSYQSHGVRRFIVGNYSIFYTVYEKSGNVLVLRILHNRRKWKEIL